WQRRGVTEAEETVSSRWRLVVPYLPTGAAITVAAIQVVENQSLEPVLFWILVALVALVVCRQFLTLSANHALLQHLGEREAEMRHQAFHDPLTGLANRALFGRRIDAALTPVDIGSDPLIAVIVIDLDDFKDVNDTHGHEAGDRLLVEVGSRLLGCVRDADTVARLGGDEFAVLLESVNDVRHAEQVAARIVETMKHKADVGRASVRVQASVGVALARGGSVARGELMRRADVAMYAAKGHGKGRWVTYDARVDGETAVTERRPAAS
ncbi:MAG TPA: GGDEF domain-containing protein, partial [Candidatus Dormibacteraeota bacterium]|nr:GGDEF domain-containing protein [Candidatus Dormibacteraeota bacterium]